MNFNEIYCNYDIDDRFDKLIKETEIELEDLFLHHEEIAEFNQLKVIKAFNENALQSSDFFQATGYGYADTGRDTIESIFSSIFKAEDSLVRPSIVSGTHALSIVLFSLLKYGDKLLSITDDPYDTMQQVIGIAGDKKGSLIEKGVLYDKLTLDDQNKIQYNKIKDKIDENTKVVPPAVSSLGCSNPQQGYNQFRFPLFLISIRPCFNLLILAHFFASLALQKYW